MRLFVALPVDDAVREALSSAQRVLRRELPGARLRLQDPDQSHLTLRFLGEVPERYLPACGSAVEEAARGAGPLSLATGDLGAFPSQRRPSVFWLGVEGDLEELMRLQRAVSRRLDALLGTSEERSFSPHLTLARVRQLDRGSRPRLPELFASRPVESVGWRVESVRLMSSRLHTSGAVHETLLEARLDGR